MYDSHMKAKSNECENCYWFWMGKERVGMTTERENIMNFTLTQSEMDDMFIQKERNIKVFQ